VRNLITQFVSDASQSLKVAQTAAITTTGTTLTAWIEWIPNDIGKVGALIGIPITIGLFYVQWKKYKREEEKHKAWQEDRDARHLKSK